MTDQAIATLYMTADNEEEVRRIAHVLVEEKLIACANIIPSILSVYCWEGNIEEAMEVAVLMKTRRCLAKKAIMRITELHSYDIPCVTVWDVSDVQPDYQNWVYQNTVS